MPRGNRRSGVTLNTFWAGPGAQSADRALHKVNHAIRHGAAVSLVGGCSTATQGTASYWDPNSGNLLKQVKLPAAGPMSPVIRFTYNNQGTSVASIGGGFSMNYVRRVSEINSTTADVLDGMGTTLRYTNKNAVTGQYDPPAGARNGLVKNASGTWTETQPDETRLQYLSGTNGRLKAIEAKTGTWTILFNASDQVKTILDPATQRTTLVYGTGMPNLLRYVQDPAGRRTTLTRDIVHHVTKFQTPLGSVSLTYVSPFDGNSPLKAWASPDGTRATFLFDSSSPKRLRAMFAAGTTGYTMTYSGSTTRALKDPRGYVSTMLFNADGQVRATVSPTNDRTTIAWSSGFPTVLQNPLGHRTTLAYATASSGVKRLKMIQTPVAGRFTWVYDASDRLKATIDQMGRRATLLYDAGGNRSAEINALGNRLTILWQSGQVKAVVNPLGFRWTSIYDASGRNTAYVNPLGNRWTFGFTSNSIQTTVKTPLGHVWTTLFDSMNRPRAWINPLGFRTTATYDASGNLRALKNPLGFTTTTLFDSSSRKRAVINPLGNRTTYGFDSAGNRVSVKNPLGYVTTTVFDSENQAKAIVDALGNRTTFGSDAAGNRVTLKNALGYVTTFLFDADDRQRATIDALGYRTTLGYNGVGQVVSVKNALGKVTTNVFDAAGQNTAVVNALGNRTSFGFDSAGRRVSIKNSLGKVLTVLYDAAARRHALIEPRSNRTTFGHDIASRRVTVKDANNNVTTVIYDSADREYATISALGNRTTHILDANGQRRALIDARANRNTFAFDADGRMIRVTDALGRSTTLAYDEASQQTLRIDARGYRTTYVLDAIGRLTGRRYPNGTRVTFAYDALGNRTTMHDSLGRYTTTFDQLTRHRTVTNTAAKTITYAYDAVSQRRVIVDPDGGRFTYLFDDAGRNRSIVNPQAERTTCTFDVAGRTTLRRMANGTRASFTHDDDDHVIALYNLKSDGTVISSFTFFNDPVGNRTRVVEANSDRVTWTYDATYQLTRERRSGANAYDSTYNYDPVGNRRVKLDSGVRTTHSYNVANELSWYDAFANRTTFTYDATGNVTIEAPSAGGRTTFVWDYERRLSNVHLPNATRQTFFYDPDSMRVKSIDPTGTTFFLWDDKNVLLEADSLGATSVSYTLQPHAYGALVSARRATETSYFHFDQIGSTRQVTSASQVVSATHIYRAFGEPVLASGGSDLTRRYVGQYGYHFDATRRQYYVRSRFYYPEIGRWLSQDVSVSEKGQYRYVLNNPVLFHDPSGAHTAKFCFDWYDVCLAAAKIRHKTCRRRAIEWYEKIACDVRYRFEKADCDDDFLLCMLTSEEALQALAVGVTVGAIIAVVIIAIAEPTPVGEVVVIGAIIALKEEAERRERANGIPTT